MHFTQSSLKNASNCVIFNFIRILSFNQIAHLQDLVCLFLSFFGRGACGDRPASVWSVYTSETSISNQRAHLNGPRWVLRYVLWVLGSATPTPRVIWIACYARKQRKRGSRDSRVPTPAALYTMILHSCQPFAWKFQPEVASQIENWTKLASPLRCGAQIIIATFNFHESRRHSCSAHVS